MQYPKLLLCVAAFAATASALVLQVGIRDTSKLSAKLMLTSQTELNAGTTIPGRETEEYKGAGGKMCWELVSVTSIWISTGVTILNREAEEYKGAGGELW